jgi:hypothetical protein
MSTDKEIAERLAKVRHPNNLTGDPRLPDMWLATNDVIYKRTGYAEACLLLLPKIREAVEALENIGHANSCQWANSVLTCGTEYGKGRPDCNCGNTAALASLRGVLTPQETGK